MDRFLIPADAAETKEAVGSLNLLSWNVDSLTPASGLYKNRNKLSELLAEMGPSGSPDIINLQEVKRTSTEGMPPLPGYFMAASALALTRANGCAIYVRSSMSADVTQIADFDTEIDGKKQGRLVGVRLTLPPPPGEDVASNGPIAIFGVYAVNTLGKPSSREKELERATMDAALRTAIFNEVSRNSKTRIIVAGDLNVTMTLLDKGKLKDTKRWGESHYEDISSPITRVEELMTEFDLEDSFRATHPGQKVSRLTYTTTYASNSTFGRDGCRLDYILISRKRFEKAKEKEEEGGKGSEPTKKRQKTEQPRWFTRGEVYKGKGWRLSNDSPGSGSDHLPCVLTMS